MLLFVYVIFTCMFLASGNRDDLERRVQSIETYILQELLQMKNAIYTMKEDIVEMKLLNNKSVPETHQQKADIKNELKALAEGVVEDLKLEIHQDLFRVRRAFFEEKSSLKTEIENFRNIMKDIDKTTKESMQSITVSFQNLSEEMTLQQETNLRKQLVLFESGISSINKSVNGTISLMVTSVKDSLQDIDQNIDNKIDDAADSMSMCKKKIDNHDKKIDRKFKVLFYSLFPYISPEGYLYPLNAEGFRAPERRTVVRLANTTGDANTFFGRLEVNYEGEWGTVCDDGFTGLSAKVACGMFGFISGEMFCCAARGRGLGQILLDDVICHGNETTIFDCPRRNIRQHDCNHNEDVSVQCSGRWYFDDEDFL